MTMPSDLLAYNQKLIETFRAAGGASMGDRPLLLLTTTGARSGRPRTSPIMYVRDGDRLIVIASANGAARDPNWIHNLRADPRVTVELPGDTYAATATELSGAERDRVWAEIIRDHAFFVEHQQRAGERLIPLVALDRVA
jgi:deazaflavin-dependent oxidoreductase (nitroreductase family)